MSEDVAFTEYGPSLHCFTYQANSNRSMSHRADPYVSHFSGGLKGLCLLILLLTDKTKSPSWSSQCFLQWQRARGEADCSSAGPSCNGNGSPRSRVRNRFPSSLCRHMGTPPAKRVSFFVTASSCTGIPFNEGIEDCAVALQAPSQLVTHTLRRTEFFLSISHQILRQEV